MPRKRLRPFLEEVISDADLHASAERVAELPPAPAGPPALTIAAADAAPADAAPAAFPPPPWESEPSVAPVLPVAPPAPPGNGTHATADAVAAPALVPQVADEPAPSTTVAVTPAPPEADVHVATPADTAHAGRRRRRSASLLPPLPSATDLPEDAAGRVAVLSVPAPSLPDAVGDDHAADTAPSCEPTSTQPRTAPAPITAVGGGDAPLAGWVPVLALGVVLVVIFVIGILVTR